MALRTISIRAKLLWIVPVLLIIPWMGYYYVLEMKQFLVQGQKNALLLTANGVATVLNDRAELFNPETGVPEVLGNENDLYAHELDNLIQLDGKLGDWESIQRFANFYTGDELLICSSDYDPDSFSLKNIIGHYQQYLYALFEINDDKLVYRDLEKRSLDASDQIRMLVQLPNETLEHYLLVASEPGRMSIFLVDEQWKLPLEGDDVTAFTAELAETEWGYQIELRIPRDVIGYRSRVGFFAVDVDSEENREISAVLSTSPQISGAEPAQILLTSPELTKILKGLDQPQSRIWILDNLQRVRAVVGGLSPAPPPGSTAEEENNWAIRFIQNIQDHIDALLKRPPVQFTDISTEVSHRPDKIFTTILKGVPKVEQRLSMDQKAQIIVAGYPIKSRQEILGAVIVEQSNHAILGLQYQLLRSLTLVTILVFFFILLTLFIFAWRLTLRIRRLHNTTEKAITPEGRVIEDRIPSRIYPADELGDLGRSITSMLKRLSGYTRYLEGMPDTLAHELNNPLNVVSSSLEILETDVPNIDQNKHMQRARNGVNRLRIILTNLTEAANLEEAMRTEIKKPVDLPGLISEFMDGYRSSYPEHKFLLQIGASPLVVDCSPDHLAQMLDKLIDNAMQFSKPGTPIIVSTNGNKDHAEITVLNEGPKLPEKINDRLFDPMVSYGKTNAKHSHLGLGLFVVRLIAEYHQGTSWAENRPDNQGVAVTVSIPVTHSNPFTVVRK
ncbi:ATP-binding protein [Candidatus Spongiihabitans sp.]|uniref:ATP-binding protein n=1 Tax=Candidatus Spongiihabitans sp. TaxID=3101308 RepID=UPI003C6F0146